MSACDNDFLEYDLHKGKYLCQFCAYDILQVPRTVLIHRINIINICWNEKKSNLHSYIYLVLPKHGLLIYTYIFPSLGFFYLCAVVSLVTK